ncbi:hypothetical protein FRB96_001073 [Tulasnella sp. 330]|nr:hypothetical protein FRB96_001073 [Tulasnella sp. 330]KAG8873651.1 hypothetical protein FRB97_006556 [Tulasnella sp. 331]KAG8877722.1 hypothetical protein FRB98_006565 [Tulasnella sp. 332]
MSALTRSKPSFVIYRDEPEVIQTSSHDTTTTNTSTDNNTIKSPRPALSISTSFSINDKENSAPYPTATGGKQLKATKQQQQPKAAGLTTKSAPTSPLLQSTGPSGSSIRSALATKFVAPSKTTRVSSNNAKSKSQSSTLKRSGSSQNASGPTIELGSSVAEKTRPRVKRSVSTSSVSGRKASSKPKVTALTSLTETLEEGMAFGPDGLTAADRRAKDLTQLPLADISAAYTATTVAPEGSTDVQTLSRKRSRSLTIMAEEEEDASEPLGSQEPNSSSQHPTLISTQPEREPAGEPSSCPSPSKKCRLSPIGEVAPQLPLSAQPTLLEELLEVPNHEATFIEL